MPRIPDSTKPLYVAASAFVRRALADDDSLFTPGQAIWTAANLELLTQHFIENPDWSGDKFEVKLQKQLADTPDPVVQLMAEVLFAHMCRRLRESA